MKVIVEINDEVAEQYKNINSVVHHLLYCELYKVTSENEITVTSAAELEYKAAKWDNPQTQADLELAAAVRWAIETYGKVMNLTECVNSYRERKRGAE